MKHCEYVRIKPESKNAVLFIHGIVGTPNHFATPIALVDAVPWDWSVYNLLLPGHGSTVADFADSSMKEWWNAARDAFFKLAERHERVWIVGHSMGTLFALELAVAYPEKIPGLFLLGVPMRPHLSPAAINSALRLALGKLRPGYPEMSIQEACGTTPTWKLWKYIPWVPRFLELFRQIHATERKLAELHVPAVAFQSSNDELVSNASSKVLRQYPIIDLQILEHSTHFFYSPEDTALVLGAFRQMLGI